MRSDAQKHEPRPHRGRSEAPCTCSGLFAVASKCDRIQGTQHFRLKEGTGSKAPPMQRCAPSPTVRDRALSLTGQEAVASLIFMPQNLLNNVLNQVEALLLPCTLCFQVAGRASCAVCIANAYVPPSCSEMAFSKASVGRTSFCPHSSWHFLLSPVSRLCSEGSRPSLSCRVEARAHTRPPRPSCCYCSWNSCSRPRCPTVPHLLPHRALGCAQGLPY